MENESDIQAGDETQSGAGALADETNAVTDELITDAPAQWEEFGDEPRKTGEQTEDETEGAETDEASKAAAAAAPVETEEEKAINAELQAVPESGRFRAMRTMLVTAQKAAKEFEAELETARGVMFRPTVPAEEFSTQGKAKEFWDNVAKEHPAYYAPMVQDMIRTELTPERLAAGNIPEPTFNALADVFSTHWLPDFLTKTFGIGVQEFSQLVDRHRAGTLTAESSTNGNGAQVGLTAEEITALGLDPQYEADQKVITALNAERKRAHDAQAGVSSELNQLRTSLAKLTDAQTGTVKQQQEAAQAGRVNAFEGLLSADRQGLLEGHLKRIPRDAQGNIVKGYEHLPQQIADRVDLVLSRNTDYQAKKGHASMWFKQPGSAETAKQLASGDLKAVYAHHKVEIARIVAQELAPYASLINATKALDAERRTRTVIPGGASPSTESESALRPQSRGGRKPSLADRVLAQG